MKPLVSVLIPCYNAEKWLSQTIESILAQTWDNTEIILVDDGSTDNSLAIAKSFELNNLKVISQVNSGASTSRNRALKESQGDFIQYLDADDLLAPDKIERQVRLLSNQNSEYVACGEWARFHTSLEKACFIPEPVWKDMSTVDWLICSWEGGGMMALHSWLVPRKISEIAGYWNEDLSLNDDGEYFCRVVLASKGVKFCPGAKSYYRSRINGSLSNINSSTAWKSAFVSLESCSNYLIAKENSSRTRAACANIFQRFIYSAYPDVLELVKMAETKVKFFGGSDLKPCGGSIFELVTKIFGWKIAKRIQRFIQGL